jgi:tyrosyl-tRNA synthetase
MDKNLLTEFKNRGYFFQCTNENHLEKLLSNKKISFYIGFDCTAPSLHVGSLIQIMCLRLFQKYGHKPIVLLGGGTTMVGDPSGKEETRKILTESQIQKNINQIKNVFAQFLDSKGNNKVIYVNNKKWLSKLNYINFLREYGKHFTINKMLAFDSVKLRLEREQSLSFLEFNYMILQAYDYLELFKKNKCALQIGGSDQWGNIINGVELIRKEVQGEAFGLTTPLITTAQGTKMGKTESGAVWLNEDLVSSYDYWQFWRNTDDRDVIRYLYLFTEIETEEIKKYESYTGNKLNELKILLANEATILLHGNKAAEKAAETSKSTFEARSTGDDLPSKKIKKKEIEKGFLLKDILLEIKFASSGGDFKRNIKNNAYRINNIIENNEEKKITLKDSLNNQIKISFGKKKHFVVNII